MNIQLKVSILAIAAACFCCDLSARAIDSSTPTQYYPPLSQEEIGKYNQQLQQAIQNAENRVATAQKFATRRDVAPTWDSKLELQQAITMLEVKKTLMNNFLGTESLRSAAVRTKLLNLLNSPDITTADLAALQNLVLNEKERIRAEDDQEKEREKQDSTLQPQ